MDFINVQTGLDHHLGDPDHQPSLNLTYERNEPMAINYQNEKTLRDLNELVASYAATIDALTKRIDAELDKPTAPSIATGRETNRKAAVSLTPALQETVDLLKSRPYPVTIRTICRNLNITVLTARWRIYNLRKAGVNIQSLRGKGTRLAKYRVA